MTLRNTSPRRVESFERTRIGVESPADARRIVAGLASHFGRSPARLGVEEIRAYQVYLTNEQRLAPASMVITVAALRFLYTVTLQRIVRPEPVLSQERSGHP